MKKTTIRVLAVVMLIALLAMSMAACSTDTYSQLADKGYTLKVIYDVGEADVGGKEITTIVEVFNPDKAIAIGGENGFYLLPLDSDDRKDDVRYELEKYDKDNRNLFLVGWYKERTEGENGYTYSGLWDFKKDLLSLDEFDENGDFYLYAAWAPRVTYEFYAKNEAGEFELKGSAYKLKLEYPDVKNAQMKDYPESKGKTFEGAYWDEAMTAPITGDIDARDMYVDYEKGIVTTTVVKIYVAYS